MTRMTYRQFVERQEKFGLNSCIGVTCSECPFDDCQHQRASDLLPLARTRARMEVSEKLELI
jgi:hypothetical protein